MTVRPETILIDDLGPECQKLVLAVNQQDKHYLIQRRVGQVTVDLAVLKPVSAEDKPPPWGDSE